jgi:hypothetical protein
MLNLSEGLMHNLTRLNSERVEKFESADRVKYEYDRLGAMDRGQYDLWKGRAG